jgi:hypothetical protein
MNKILHINKKLHELLDKKDRINANISILSIDLLGNITALYNVIKWAYLNSWHGYYNYILLKDEKYELNFNFYCCFFNNNYDEYGFTDDSIIEIFRITSKLYNLCEAFFHSFAMIILCLNIRDCRDRIIYLSREYFAFKKEMDNKIVCGFMEHYKKYGSVRRKGKQIAKREKHIIHIDSFDFDKFKLNKGRLTINNKPHGNEVSVAFRSNNDDEISKIINHIEQNDNFNCLYIMNSHDVYQMYGGNHNFVFVIIYVPFQLIFALHHTEHNNYVTDCNMVHIAISVDNDINIFYNSDNYSHDVLNKYNNRQLIQQLPISGEFIFNQWRFNLISQRFIEFKAGELISYDNDCCHINVCKLYKVDKFTHDIYVDICEKILYYVIHKCENIIKFKHIVHIEQNIGSCMISFMRENSYYNPEVNLIENVHVRLNHDVSHLSKNIPSLKKNAYMENMNINKLEYIKKEYILFDTIFDLVDSDTDCYGVYVRLDMKNNECTFMLHNVIDYDVIKIILDGLLIKSNIVKYISSNNYTIINKIVSDRLFNAIVDKNLLASKDNILCYFTFSGNPYEQIAEELINKYVMGSQYIKFKMINIMDDINQIC